jgi:serine protease Do
MQDYTPPPSMSSRPVGPAPPRQFPLLVVILLMLLAAWLVPSFVERVEYSATLGRERAEVDVARGALSEHRLDDISRAFAQIAKAIGPSVVHINTLQRIAAPRDEWLDFFGQPREYEAQGQGSGVIIDSQGYILTNNHVVAGAQQIEVVLSDGRSLEATRVGNDAAIDLAVLKIQAENLIAAEWGDSTKLPVGSLVWAIGNPYGLDRSITFGIISAKDRQGVGNSLLQKFLQTDAAVNPGNSGGPLVDVNARVIGINTAIIGPTYHGIGFSIPSELARDVYEQLKSSGTVVRAWLGVALQVLTPDVAKELDLKDTKGALVKGVEPNSPAAKAGIRKGDFIVEWNKQPVASANALPMMVAGTPIGSHATVVVIRNGEKLTLDVPVEQRPPNL